jgi:hypothetical protein
VTAARYDITITQGTTVNQVWTWLDGQQDAVDLTGYSAHMQVRAYGSGSALVADFSSAGGALQLGGTAGTITLVIAAAVTSGYVWSAGNYELDMTDPGGNVTSLLRGIFTVVPAIVAA